MDSTRWEACCVNGINSSSRRRPLDNCKRPVKPLPRHAELAVNMAGSMASSLLATFEARINLGRTFEPDVRNLNLTTRREVRYDDVIAFWSVSISLQRKCTTYLYSDPPSAWPQGHSKDRSQSIVLVNLFSYPVVHCLKVRIRIQTIERLHCLCNGITLIEVQPPTHKLVLDL
jgi:hypothetical protein